MDDKFLKPYDSTATEGRIYSAWEKSGLFNPDECVAQGVYKSRCADLLHRSAASKRDGSPPCRPRL